MCSGHLQVPALVPYDPAKATTKSFAPSVATAELQRCALQLFSNLVACCGLREDTESSVAAPLLDAVLADSQSCKTIQGLAGASIGSASLDSGAPLLS